MTYEALRLADQLEAAGQHPGSLAYKAAQEMRRQIELLHEAKGALDAAYDQLRYDTKVEQRVCHAILKTINTITQATKEAA